MLQRANGPGRLYSRDASRLAAAEPLTGRIAGFILGEYRRFLPHSNVHQTGQRAEARAEPVSGAMKTGMDHAPVLGGLGARKTDRASLRVQARCPRLLSELRAANELAGGAIQHIVEAVPVRDHHELSLAGIDEHR